MKKTNSYFNFFWRFEKSEVISLRNHVMSWIYRELTKLFLHPRWSSSNFSTWPLSRRIKQMKCSLLPRSTFSRSSTKIMINWSFALSTPCCALLNRLEQSKVVRWKSEQVREEFECLSCISRVFMHCFTFMVSQGALKYKSKWQRGSFFFIRRAEETNNFSCFCVFAHVAWASLDDDWEEKILSSGRLTLVVRLIKCMLTIFIVHAWQSARVGSAWHWIICIFQMRWLVDSLTLTLSLGFSYF